MFLSSGHIWSIEYTTFAPILRQRGQRYLTYLGFPMNTKRLLTSSSDTHTYFSGNKLTQSHAPADEFITISWVGQQCLKKGSWRCPVETHGHRFCYWASACLGHVLNELESFFNHRRLEQERLTRTVAPHAVKSKPEDWWVRFRPEMKLKLRNQALGVLEAIMKIYPDVTSYDALSREGYRAIVTRVKMVRLDTVSRHGGFVTFVFQNGSQINRDRADYFDEAESS